MAKKQWQITFSEFQNNCSCNKMVSKSNLIHLWKKMLSGVLITLGGLLLLKSVKISYI